MSVEKKQQLVKTCLDYVEERIQKIDKAIQDLEAALKLETKCSMGDKYETGRAMLHLEFEKLSGQHEQYQKLRRTVKTIEIKKPQYSAGFGAVVETRQVNYFIAIPAGKISVEGKTFYAVGAGAPIALALAGKSTGETIVFNGNELTITGVY